MFVVNKDETFRSRLGTTCKFLPSKGHITY